MQPVAIYHANPPYVRLTLAGSVQTGTFTNKLSGDLELFTLKIPVAGPIGAPANEPVSIYRLRSDGSYAMHHWDPEFNAWQPTAPQIQVGETIWVKSLREVRWTTSFFVN